jgi:hypothetical protein
MAPAALDRVEAPADATRLLFEPVERAAAVRRARHRRDEDETAVDLRRDVDVALRVGDEEAPPQDRA